MDSIARDLRFAVRSLLRKPVYTAAALLALSLGVGANTAIFSVFDALLLSPLPYPEPDRLVQLWETNASRAIDESRCSPVTFADLREQTESFENLTGWWHPDLNLTSDDGEPLRARAINVTDNFFDTIGVDPALGRGFRPGEDVSGAARIAVIGHGLWQRRFGGDAEILGRDVTLDGVDYEIVGVAPEGFRFPGTTEIWLPLYWNPAQHSRHARFFHVLGRLDDGVALETAQSEVAGVLATIARDFPRSNEGWSAEVRRLADDVLGDVRSQLVVLLAAVGFVLAIACANVANLLLAQAVAREREVAVRCALGAGRRQLVRQFLTESLVLGLVGGAAGLAVATGGVHLLLALAPPEIPRLDEVAVDARVLAYTLIVAVAASLLFGLAPAVHALRTRVGEALKEGSRGASTGVGGRRVRQVLVVLETAVALVLLIAAGLLIRSFGRLLAEDPGFRPEGVLAFNLQLPRSSYGEWTDVAALYQRLNERLATLPGVEAAAASAFLPLELGWRVDFAIDNAPALSDRDQPEAQYHIVTPGYFRLMGVPLLQGRDFDRRDRPDTPGAVILNRAAVDRYFGDRPAVGERITGGTDGIGPLGRLLTGTREAEIVGVVGDVKNTALEDAAEPTIYFSVAQFAYRSMNVLVRGAPGTEDPRRLESSLKAAVWELDDQLPVAEVKTLEEHLGAALARRRFVMTLLAAFAGLALALATIGIYGVMSMIAGERRREVGIRVALGARRGEVVGLLLGQGFRLVAAGTALGLGAALLVHRFLDSLVFGVATTDAAAFGGVVAILVLTALAACYLPARRASKTDPIVVLREE